MSEMSLEMSPDIRSVSRRVSQERLRMYREREARVAAGAVDEINPATFNKRLNDITATLKNLTQQYKIECDDLQKMLLELDHIQVSELGVFGSRLISQSNQVTESMDLVKAPATDFNNLLRAMRADEAELKRRLPDLKLTFGTLEKDKLRDIEALRNELVALLSSLENLMGQLKTKYLDLLRSVQILAVKNEENLGELNGACGAAHSDCKELLSAK